jgi:hypothetical protein
MKLRRLLTFFGGFGAALAFLFLFFYWADMIETPTSGGARPYFAFLVFGSIFPFIASLWVALSSIIDEYKVRGERRRRGR